MKVYHNLGIQNHTGLVAGTVGFPFRITDARMLPRAYGEKDALSLSLKESLRRPGSECGYGLIGDEIYKSFMIDMKVSKVEELVGREVIGFIPPSPNITLHGISVIEA